MPHTSIITRDLQEISEPTGNLYYSIIVLGKRARQISIKTQGELKTKLDKFAEGDESAEETHENHEQTKISKFYEKKPKPPAVAIEEFCKNKTYFSLTKSESID